MHKECNALESSRKHPQPMSVEKRSSVKLVPGAKKVGDHCSKGKVTQNFKDITLSLTVLILISHCTDNIWDYWVKRLSQLIVPVIYLYRFLLFIYLLAMPCSL